MFQPPLKALVRPAPHATELRIVRENRFHSFCRNRQIKATFCYFCSTVLSCCSQHGCVKTTLSIYSIKSLYLKTKQSCFKPLLVCLAFKLLVWTMLLVARFACSLSCKVGSQKVSFLIFFLLWSPLPHISPIALVFPPSRAGPQEADSCWPSAGGTALPAAHQLCKDSACYPDPAAASEKPSHLLWPLQQFWVFSFSWFFDHIPLGAGVTQRVQEKVGTGRWARVRFRA